MIKISSPALSFTKKTAAPLPLVKESLCFLNKTGVYQIYCINAGADPGGIECSSRYGQIFPIMNTKIVLGKNSILIYFHAIHFCLQK